MSAILFIWGGGGWLSSMHHRSHDQGGLHPGGGSASSGRVCIRGGLPPGESASRGLGRSPQVCLRVGVGRAPPPEIHGILRDTVNKRVVCILLECILVKNYLTAKNDPIVFYTAGGLNLIQ